ncbi:TetR/AcrR family transcriptional regulator [Deinococcus sp.]|uniref:TetR/AcrR family transcriptional regulator n=1 Tax=Deinococcus sp. TaxID=47478 RepID=UPI00286DB2F4|nr:TetR/AcrR family transcriptional regulator [Deinococcus sp.]
MTDTNLLLLQAAATVIRRAGSLNLTLDAVAREAGVSKGGLLYHFPNKEALVAGLIGHELDCGERLLGEFYERDEVTPGRWARAYTALTLNGDPSQDVSAGLMAAVALNPELLEPVRERYRQWDAEAEADGLEPGLGTLLRLAMDGLWLADLLNLAPPGAQGRQTLAELVRRLSGGAGSGAGQGQMPALETA